MIYNILSIYFSKFYIFNKKSILSPGCAPGTRGTYFFVPFLSLGHFGGQKCLFLRLKVMKYKHLQIWISKKTRSKLNVFVFSMVLFAKSMSPDNIFWKYCPTSFPITYIVIHTMYSNPTFKGIQRWFRKICRNFAETNLLQEL